jgi:hypothetical protein
MRQTRPLLEKIGVELRKVCDSGRDDGALQGELLPSMPIHAEEAREVGIEAMVFGGFIIKIHLQF